MLRNRAGIQWIAVMAISMLVSVGRANIVTWIGGQTVPPPGQLSRASQRHGRHPVLRPNASLPQPLCGRAHARRQARVDDRSNGPDHRVEVRTAREHRLHGILEPRLRAQGHIWAVGDRVLAVLQQGRPSHVLGRFHRGQRRRNSDHLLRGRQCSRSQGRIDVEKCVQHPSGGLGAAGEGTGDPCGPGPVSA